MPRHCYGHRPDPPEHRMISFRCLGAAPTTPNEVDLKAFAPPVMDQDGTSSCVGHAIAGGLVTACAKQGKSLSFIPSPMGIYTNARALDRRLAGGVLPPLADVGCEPNQATYSIAEWGIRPMRPLPDRLSDADPATVNHEPLLGDLEIESETLMLGTYRIDTFGLQRIADIRAALAGGYAVAFATFVDQAFEVWNPSKGPLGAPDLSDSEGGSHYVYATGYRTEGGCTLVDFRNAWGVSWGDRGDGVGNEDFIAGMSDLYVLSVRRA